MWTVHVRPFISLKELALMADSMGARERKDKREGVLKAVVGAGGIMYQCGGVFRTDCARGSEAGA